MLAPLMAQLRLRTWRGKMYINLFVQMSRHAFCQALCYSRSSIKNMKHQTMLCCYMVGISHTEQHRQQVLCNTLRVYLSYTAVVVLTFCVFYFSQAVGRHHGVPWQGNKHWLLSPGGCTGRSADRGRAHVLLCSYSRHLQEWDKGGKEELQTMCFFSRLWVATAP